MHFKRAVITYSKAVGGGGAAKPASFQEGCLDPNLCSISQPPSRKQTVCSEGLTEESLMKELCAEV